MNTITYLNTAACGLVDADVRQAGVALYEAFEQNSSARSEKWRFEEEVGIRETIAAFIGGDAKNIAMLPNFSWGMNGIVQSLKGKANRVLLYRGDYPSVLEPFKINGFDITWVEAADEFTIPVDEIKKQIEAKNVEIVAISHVQWTSGYRMELNEIGALCRQHGVIFIVDATQSMGAVPINVLDIQADVFIASNYKWMNAGFGTGIMHITDAFLDAYPPIVGGNNGYAMLEGKWQYVASAKSYEPGHPNMFGLSVLKAAIEHKNKIGLQQIWNHNMQLTALLLKHLENIPVNIIGDYSTYNRTSIVFVKDEKGLGEWLRQHNIVVTHRDGNLRISMHFYNTEADVMRLVDVLHAFCNK